MNPESTTGHFPTGGWGASNMIERLNKEILRRTRVATLFPNEASLLRLVSAMLAEVDEEWQTGKTYLNTETD